MSRKALGAAFGAIALVFLGAPSPEIAKAQDVTATGDTFLPASGDWQTYVNDRYGTRITYPTDLFTPDEPPQNGDGRRFFAEDAQIEVYAWNNIDGETAASLKRRLVGSEGYEDVTYSPSGSNWLVLSGHRGDSIFYEKYFVRGDVIHAMGMEFPADRKPFYAPVVERVENSFRAG